MYSKMLKETETEETIVFFVTFLSLVAFQLGGRAPWAPSGPLGQRLCYESQQSQLSFIVNSN